MSAPSSLTGWLAGCGAAEAQLMTLVLTHPVQEGLDLQRRVAEATASASACQPAPGKADVVKDQAHDGLGDHVRLVVSPTPVCMADCSLDMRCIQPTCNLHGMH